MVTARVAVTTVLISASTACSAKDVTGGRLLYVENCASCHGLGLQGQPDWMKRLPSGRMPAPPHDETGHTWHHSDEQLRRITLDGLAAIAPGYETDMPAFRGILGEHEVEAILEYIKSTWPDRTRESQRTRSKAK